MFEPVPVGGMLTLMKPMKWRSANVVALTALVAAGCGPDGPVELPRILPGPSAVEYPVELWDLGLEGETTIMVLVNETGAVDSVFVDRRSGFEDFDSAAVRGGRRMRFSPGRRGDDRVSVWVRVPVRFEKGEREGSVGAPGSGS
jgi:TonB family protein